MWAPAAIGRWITVYSRESKFTFSFWHKEGLLNSLWNRYSLRICFTKFIRHSSRTPENMKGRICTFISLLCLWFWLHQLHPADNGLTCWYMFIGSMLSVNVSTLFCFYKFHRIKYRYFYYLGLRVRLRRTLNTTFEFICAFLQ